MSHLHERKEKICLNCHAELIDRYCHHCGQENLEPKETVWHLVQHFFNDVTHFDGKFFSSVKFLLTKPGHLSKEYMMGRRASYLNPIRMYVFSSAIFFLLLFSTSKPDDLVHINRNDNSEPAGPGKTYAELVKSRDKLENTWINEHDKEDKKDLESRKVKLDLELAMIKKIYGDSTTRTFDKNDLNLLLARAIKDTILANVLTKSYGPESGGADGGKKEIVIAEGSDVDTTGLPGDGGLPGDAGAAARAARSGKKDLLNRLGDTGTYRYKGPGSKGTDSRVTDLKTADRREGHSKDSGSGGGKIGKGDSIRPQPKKGLAQQAGDKLAKVDDKLQKKHQKDGDDDDDDWNFTAFGIPVGQYHSEEQYDSTQRTLPEHARDGWLRRQTTRKLIHAQEEMRVNREQYFEHFVEAVLHNIPKILFISLPIFAMILNILYFRRKKTYYYVSHGIFTIHLYCATFILGMGLILLSRLYSLWNNRLIHILIGLMIFFIVLYLLIYLYKAMRGFYGQGRMKTFVKYVITFWLAFIINTILLVLFILISAISI